MSDEKTDPATLTVEASEETKPVLQSCVITCPSSPRKDKEEHWPGVKDRDPHHINSDVKVTFRDIIGEPDEDLYAFDKIWQLSGKLFNSSRRWSYRILTLILALPLALCWGACFACLGFSRIWCWVPCIRGLEIKAWFWRRYVEIWVGVCVRPVYHAIGQLFASINVTQRQVSAGAA